ncbi:MAG: hydrolase [Candidatus Marinimicrobia bacterium]|nr:hydrolase [Candidatus Neomarinimicrobiota bacterium]
MKLLNDQSVLVMIDVQSRLFPAMNEKDQLLTNLVKAVKGFQLLGLPLIVTEQYRKGLGPTLPELSEIMPTFNPIEKRAFSCCGDDSFLDELKRIKRKQVIVCGIEAHVCVYQTCRDLLDLGYEVFLLTDAVSSRNVDDKRLTIRVLESMGVQLRSVEMALFELLNTSLHAQFKKVSTIIK